MGKVENLILSLLLFAGCRKEILVDESDLLFPPLRKEFLVREGLDGYDEEIKYYKYFLREYDCNKNGKIDAYTYFNLNPRERIFTGDSLAVLPNFIYLDADEKGNMDYMWIYDKKIGNYVFSEYKAK